MFKNITLSIALMISVVCINAMEKDVSNSNNLDTERRALEIKALVLQAKINAIEQINQSLQGLLIDPKATDQVEVSSSNESNLQDDMKVQQVQNQANLNPEKEALKEELKRAKQNNKVLETHASYLEIQKLILQERLRQAEVHAQSTQDTLNQVYDIQNSIPTFSDR